MNWWARQLLDRAPRRAAAALAAILEHTLARTLGAVDVTPDQQPTHGTGPWCDGCGRPLR